MRQRQSTEERRSQIAKAALAIIAEQGLGGFTTAAIAREVGIAEGTVFRHFRNKEEIVAAAIHWLGDLFREAAAPPHSDPIARLEAFFKARMAVIEAHPGVARLLFSDQLAAAAGEESARLVLVLQRESARFVRDCLDEAAAAGRIREGIVIDDLVVVLIGATLALVQHAELPGKELPLGARAARIWATIISLVSV